MMTNLSDETIIAVAEDALIARTETLLAVYNGAKTPIVCIGVVGHVLTLMTLFRSANMAAASFLYHKALTIAELVYCLNCIVQDAIDAASVGDDHELASSWFGASYSATISRVVSSCTGYAILYTTLLTAADRCVAMLFFTHYARVSTRRFVLGAICTSMVLSVFVNSWSSWFENVVVQRSIDNSTLYRYVPRRSPPFFIQLRDIKNAYNAVIRIAYPILLALLTAGVMVGLKQYAVRQTRLARKEVKRERNLFCLLVLIVILAFMQVVPAEAKRILEAFYPAPMLRATYANETIAIERRLTALKVAYVGHVWGKIIANLCTFLTRSLSFYLYFVFNRMFRVEVMKVLPWYARAATGSGGRGSGARLLDDPSATPEPSVFVAEEVAEEGHQQAAVGIATRQVEYSQLLRPTDIPLCSLNQVHLSTARRNYESCGSR